MSRRTIGGLVAVAAVGVAAVAVASPGGENAGERPPYATISIDLSDGNAHEKRGIAGTTKKPRLVYLQASTPTTINPAPPPAGVGPYIDVKLTGCAKVIDGGVAPDAVPIYQQGSYVVNKNEYHVLLAVNEESKDGQAPFTVTSHLICLKGVK